jgi:hypothetical protein
MLTADELIKRTEQRAAEIGALKLFWRSLLPEIRLPNDLQFNLWLQLHNLETARYGLERAARKHLRDRFDENGVHAIRYASKVMNGTKTESNLEEK